MSNQQIVTAAGEALMATSMVELMEKLRLKADKAIKEVFLDSLTPEQYKMLVTEAVDDFVNGTKSKRFKRIVESIYMRSADDKPPDGRILREWAGNSSYNVEFMRPNPDYDPALDPETLPGMIRAILREKVNKEFVKEIIGSPEMEQVWNTQGGFGGGYHVFEKFITKFLTENWETIMLAERKAMLSGVMGTLLSSLQSQAGRPY